MIPRNPYLLRKMGGVDLAVMSIETYGSLIDRFELYRLLNEGFYDFVSGKTKPFSESTSEVSEWLHYFIMVAIASI